MKRLTVEFHDELEKRFAAVCRMSSAKTEVGVMARAFAVYEFVLKAQAEGSVVIVKAKDGSEQEMEIR